MGRYDKNIKNELIYLFGKESSTLNFVDELSKVGDLLFFGGSIRDICLFPNNPPKPRDFDIAIKFKDENKFKEIIQNYNYQKNRFGGYKFIVANIEFDVWDLEKTWAFNNTDLKASEENLAKSVFLNIDGIVYNFNKSKVYDDLFKKTIDARKLDVNLEVNPHVELNLLRALVFREKYKEEINLSFSNKLIQMFNKYSENQPKELLNNLYNLQGKHYKKHYFTKERIKHELESMKV